MAFHLIIDFKLKRFPFSWYQFMVKVSLVYGFHRLLLVEMVRVSGFLVAEWIINSFRFLLDYTFVWALLGIEYLREYGKHVR